MAARTIKKLFLNLILIKQKRHYGFHRNAFFVLYQKEQVNKIVY